MLLILDVSAKPSLNMKVNNFQCQKSFINNSFESSAPVKGLHNFSYLNIYTGRLNIVDDVIRVIPEDITCSIVRTF